MMCLIAEETPPKVIASTLLSHEHRTNLTALVKLIGGSETDNIQEATHVVTPTDEIGRARQSRKVLEAVAHGKWLIGLDWVLKSQQEGIWVDELEFEVASNPYLNPDLKSNPTPT